MGGEGKLVGYFFGMTAEDGYRCVVATVGVLAGHQLAGINQVLHALVGVGRALRGKQDDVSFLRQP